MTRRFRSHLAILLGGAVAVQVLPCVALSADQVAQLLEEHKQAPASITMQPRGSYLLTAPHRTGAEVGAVDASGCWYHLRHRDAAQAQREFDRLVAENPGWVPPDELVSALRREQVRAALASGKPDEVRRLAATLPAVSPCDQPDVAWAVADGEALLRMARTCGNPGVAGASMDRYLNRLPPEKRGSAAAALLHDTWQPAVRAALQRVALVASLRQLAEGTLSAPEEAALRRNVEQSRDPGGAESLGWRDLAAKRPAEARDWFAKAQSWGSSPSVGEGMARAQLALGDFVAAQALAARYPAIRPALADAYAERALAGGGTGLAFETLAQDMAQAVAMGRADGWDALGWRLMDNHRAADAALAFARSGAGEGALYGRVLAEQAQGNQPQAEALACGERGRSVRLASACADSIASRQLKAYEDGDYAAASQLGEQLETVSPGHRGGRILTAWSALRGNQPGRAADAFAGLYDQQPSTDLAQALAQSLRAAGRQGELDARVAAGDKLLAREAGRRAAATAWGRKQFDLAERHYSVMGTQAPDDRTGR